MTKRVPYLPAWCTGDGAPFLGGAPTLPRGRGPCGERDGVTRFPPLLAAALETAPLFGGGGARRFRARRSVPAVEETRGGRGARGEGGVRDVPSPTPRRVSGATRAVGRSYPRGHLPPHPPPSVEGGARATAGGQGRAPPAMAARGHRRRGGNGGPGRPPPRAVHVSPSLTSGANGMSDRAADQAIIGPCYYRGQRGRGRWMDWRWPAADLEHGN